MLVAVRHVEVDSVLEVHIELREGLLFCDRVSRVFTLALFRLYLQLRRQIAPGNDRMFWQSLVKIR